MPNLKIPSSDHGTRLDVILARAYPKYSRSFLQKVVRSGAVKLQGVIPATSYKVRAGDVLEVSDFDKNSDVTPSPEAVIAGPVVKLAGKQEPGAAPVVLFEDKFLLVLNKPAGLVVHPAPSFRGLTLIDWLRTHLGGKVTKVFTDPERLGLVHRLDKDTSGVLLIAKSVTAQIALSRQFRDRSIQKQYVAFIEGVPEAKKGVISAPVGRSKKQPHRMAVSSYGRPSETSFEVNESFKEVSQVTLHPKTGRTHQIRVHLAAIGHPIVGDQSYGAKPKWGEDFGVTRPLLHAERLDFTHPETGKPVCFEAAWPKDFLVARKTFRAMAKALSIFILFAVYMGSSAQAETGSVSPKRKSSAASNSSAAGPSTAASIKAIKRDISALEGQVAEMRAQVESIQSQFEELGVARRLHDLERAISDMNAKTSATSATSEETKTQMLEAQRKIKNQQELLDQLKDQVDRLQRESIQRRAQQEGNSSSPADVSGGATQR